MTANSSTSITRLFSDLTDVEVSEIGKARTVTRAGQPRGFSWDELLRSKRILIVSEAGAGKTFECRAQKERLWTAGEPAFFLDLATLAGSSVLEMLSREEGERFDARLRSQSEIATFFLDSIDELKLTLGKFDQALIRLNKAVAGQLARARVVITTRPVPVDRELIARHLPVPKPAEAVPTAEAFADKVMQRDRKKPEDHSSPKMWRNVGLMPLSKDQIRAFAILQGVSDPDALLADIRHRDAEEFAERPLDLIELCSDWRDHHRIRSHREQVEASIANRLKPSTERTDRASVSQEKAIEGASRLALAAMLTRRITLRYSAESDSVHASEAALDVSKILPDYDAEERATLLERPLFGFASYGRVRFHHRSVTEFLAATRLHALLLRGVSMKAIKRLLFAETAQGTRVVRPSMRPVAAWLSFWHESIFDDIIATDPAVALDHGDPQSLRPAQRIRALEAYVARYRHGGWRGLSTPRVQVRRFASSELDDAVNHLWREGIENSEVRELLLQIIGAGRLAACSDIAHTVAMDPAASIRERALAIDALLRLGDPRLEALAASLASEPARWSPKMARQAMLELFPSFMPIPRLSQMLQQIKENSRGVGDLDFWFPRTIATAELSADYLDELRTCLTTLVIDGLIWDDDKFPHLRTQRPDLISALIAVCHRQCLEGIRTEPWIASSLLVIRLSKEARGEGDAVAQLRRALAELPSDKREAAFWKEEAFLQALHPLTDAWQRVFELSRSGGIQLTVGEDAVWVRKTLLNSATPLDLREMMLWVEVHLFGPAGPSHREALEALKPLVADAPNLTAIIDRYLKPPPGSTEWRRLEAQHKRHARLAEQRTAEAHASWVKFWREIEQNPDAVFAPTREVNTAWNLWQAMERSGEESRASGWNRRFIEAQFGKAVADRLRETMLKVWRRDRPTLRSERPAEKKNTFLVKWQFGLAAIAAEAEDPNWAKKLSDQEAELACRYAPIELNGFPSWLESLAVEHPEAVDRVLGAELTLSLGEMGDANDYSMLLQDISHASAIVAALFIPRIRTWLTEIAKMKSSSNKPEAKQNLIQAVGIFTRNGSEDDRRFLASTARKKLTRGLSVTFANVWLATLLQLNPTEGVEAVERGLKNVAVSRRGAGVQLFARLFDSDYGAAGVNLSAPGFTPSLLLRLLRLSYQHIRVGEDAHHEGAFSPDTRDDAERARNIIFNALFATTGSEGWAAKLAMANDPLFVHVKDRVIALANEKAAEEADGAVLTEKEYAVLDTNGEAPPSTCEAMFALIRDRLEDVDDLLLQDVSPREAWAKITDEHVMRRELARELRHAANHSYTVDQESVTADEKETDIRLRSTGSSQQGTIELKLGDERSGTNLFDTLKGQLLTKYMVSDDCRAGCLLVTIAKDRTWKHPKTGKGLDFNDLIAMLDEEATRLSQELGGAVRLMAKGLDLRPRLRTEKTEQANRGRSRYSRRAQPRFSNKTS